MKSMLPIVMVAALLSACQREEAPAPADAEPDPASADPELLSRLKSWRTAEARRRSVPPYVIFHDRTLAAVAAARPSSPDELAKVKGVGPAKLAAYGEELLRLIR